MQVNITTVIIVAAPVLDKDKPWAQKSVADKFTVVGQVLAGPVSVAALAVAIFFGVMQLRR